MRRLFILFYVLFMFFSMLTGKVLAITCDNMTTSSVSEDAYLRLVMEHNGELGVLRKEIEAQLFSIRSEVATQRPSLMLSSNVYRWLHHDRGDRYIDLSLTHRVDLSGSYNLQEQDLLLGLNILEHNYADSVNEVLARAAKTYRKAVMAGLNRDVMMKVLQRRRDSLEVTEEKYDKEMVPVLDVLRSRSQVDEGESLVLQARQTYEKELLDMNLLAGQIRVKPVVDLSVVDDMTPSVSFDDAWKNRPDVTAIRLSKERASVRHSLAAKGLSPYLDISVGWRVGEDYRSPYVEDDEGEFLVQAVLNVPITDGNKTSNATKAAARMVEKASRELKTRRYSLTKEIDLVMERWDRGVEMRSIRLRQVDKAKKELDIAEMMYREGLLSQIDLISAQETDQKSRTNHLSALQELWLVLAEADRVMGRYVQVDMPNGNPEN